MHSRRFYAIAVVLALATLSLSALESRAEKSVEAATSSPLLQRQADLFELSLGYNYIRLERAEVKNLHGFDVSAFVNVTSWLALGGDFMAGFGNETRRFGFQNVDISGDRYVYVFGPRLSIWPTESIRIFREALAGGVHAEATGSVGPFTRSASADAFAMAFGAGADWRFAPHFSWRIIQADYLPTHFDGQWQDNWRVSTGIVFAFGGRE